MMIFSTRSEDVAGGRRAPATTTSRKRRRFHRHYHHHDNTRDLVGQDGLGGRRCLLSLVLLLVRPMKILFSVMSIVFGTISTCGGGQDRSPTSHISSVFYHLLLFSPLVVVNRNINTVVYAWTGPLSSSSSSAGSSSRLAQRRRPVILLHAEKKTESTSASADNASLHPSRSSSSSSSSKKPLTPRPAFGQALHRAAAAATSRPRKPSSAQPNSNQFSTRTTEKDSYHSPESPNHHDENPIRGDSQWSVLHRQRVSTAGRVGTQRYVNPCKVFLGNLPYNTTVESLTEWLCQTVMGLPAPVLIQQVQLVTDWRTGKSKGYAFVIFTDAVYATACLLHGRRAGGVRWQDRLIRIGPGQRLRPDPTIYVKKSSTADEEDGDDDDDEASIIRKGVREASQFSPPTISPNTQDDDDEDLVRPRAQEDPGADSPTNTDWVDAETFALLKHLDPDLLDGVQVMKSPATTAKSKPQQEKHLKKMSGAKAPAPASYSTMTDEELLEMDDLDDDLLMDDIDEDDSDDGVDGYYYGDEDDVPEGRPTPEGAEESAPTNRAQRRQAEQRIKRRKRPHKGFEK